MAISILTFCSQVSCRNCFIVNKFTFVQACLWIICTKIYMHRKNALIRGLHLPGQHACFKKYVECSVSLMSTLESGIFVMVLGISIHLSMTEAQWWAQEQQSTLVISTKKISFSCKYSVFGIVGRDGVSWCYSESCIDLYSTILMAFNWKIVHNNAANWQ